MNYGREYRRAAIAVGGHDACALAWVLLDAAFEQRTLDVRIGHRLIREETGLHGRSVDRARERLRASGLLLGWSIDGKGPRSRTVYHLAALPSADARKITSAPARTLVELSPALRRTLPELPTTAAEHVRPSADAAESESSAQSSAQSSAPGRTRSDPVENYSLGVNGGVDVGGWIENLNSYTGARWVRGSHGASHVYDPLGTDIPPIDWPYDRPTRDEIRAALAERQQ